MIVITEYKEVRIVRIVGDAAERVISSSYAPPLIPQVGETAIVVHTLANKDYVLEAGEADGRARWVAWFHENELETI